MAQDVWYYAIDDRRLGPVDRAAMERLWRERRIGPGTLVWQDGMSDWEEAGSHFADPPAPPPPARDAHPPVPREPIRSYRETVGLDLAMRRGFSSYADFSGRANRGEFWFWTLGTVLVSLAIGIVDVAALGGDGASLPGNLWALATVIPSLAVGARRLHDTGRSGWWQLIAAIPLIGAIILIVWLASEGDPDPNRFG